MDGAELEASGASARNQTVCGLYTWGAYDEAHIARREDALRKAGIPLDRIEIQPADLSINQTLPPTREPLPDPLASPSL
jgi:hypothetical protein